MVSIDLSGKTALVTGASSGLGAETARVLARAGAGVIVNYHRSGGAAEEVVRDIKAAGGKALAFQADVADTDAVAAMIAAGRQALGPVTLVVNNAGREERVAAPFELTWDDYQTMIDLNLKAIYNTASAAHADMKAAGSGRIVNVASVALNKPFPGSAAYVSGKGAMLGLTRGLATDLGADGITVNIVAPGWIPVERHFASVPKETLDQLARETPLGHYGKPMDVAHAVLFFCSDLASFITGAYVAVDGGKTVFT